MAVFLISFDIDGTLEVGDPPGQVTMEMVRRAQENGFLIGSCSDRSAASQEAIWSKHNIQADFIALKHRLDDVRGRFEADRYLHVGDTEVDRQFAEQAGFDFLWAHDADTEPWLVWVHEVSEDAS